mmetsp:Transcript_125759/g.218027  ORF Transcript_125759/g.218027 Transcript_125759/m.218027 type:complete len:302 (+) Transcript_125759:866-1771(+)
MVVMVVVHLVQLIDLFRQQLLPPALRGDLRQEAGPRDNCDEGVLPVGNQAGVLHQRHRQPPFALPPREVLDAQVPSFLEDQLHARHDGMLVQQVPVLQQVCAEDLAERVVVVVLHVEHVPVRLEGGVQYGEDGPEQLVVQPEQVEADRDDQFDPPNDNAQSLRQKEDEPEAEGVPDHQQVPMPLLHPIEGQEADEGVENDLADDGDDNQEDGLPESAEDKVADDGHGEDHGEEEDDFEAEHVGHEGVEELGRRVQLRGLQPSRLGPQPESRVTLFVLANAQNVHWDVAPDQGPSIQNQERD